MIWIGPADHSNSALRLVCVVQNWRDKGWGGDKKKTRLRARCPEQYSAVIRGGGGQVTENQRGERRRLIGEVGGWGHRDVYAMHPSPNSCAKERSLHPRQQSCQLWYKPCSVQMFSSARRAHITIRDQEWSCDIQNWISWHPLPRSAQCRWRCWGFGHSGPHPGTALQSPPPTVYIQNMHLNLRLETSKCTQFGR